MRPEAPGSSAAEVTNISPQGFWLGVDDLEIFLPFAEFPWFREASVAAICRLERPGAEHFHWPALDVDLTLKSILHPERYPLAAKH
ncbi:MAG TPA: DUF2442 domain-containing protein [Longimicrobium sp.]|jgi:hypothetical protein